MLFVGLVAIYVSAVVGTVVWRRARRKTRWPFKESDRLLRMPGETLNRQISAIEETFIFEFFGGFFTFGLICGVLAALGKYGIVGANALVSAAIGAFVIVTGASCWRIGRLWQRRANLFLGWFGERYVADQLRALELDGYRIFQDVPAEPGKDGFNLDHVAVGPGGVTVIETKTRRKGNARRGKDDHVVEFDGRQLIWPWGEDRHGIQQTKNEGQWLERWIHECTGLKVPVRRVLTFPGWYVREKPSPDLRVVNSRFVADAARGRGATPLTKEQIDLIVRQLDLRCRDVEE